MLRALSQTPSFIESTSFSKDLCQSLLWDEITKGTLECRRWTLPDFTRSLFYFKSFQNTHRQSGDWGKADDPKKFHLQPYEKSNSFIWPQCCKLLEISKWLTKPLLIPFKRRIEFIEESVEHSHEPEDLLLPPRDPPPRPPRASTTAAILHNAAIQTARMNANLMATLGIDLRLSFCDVWSLSSNSQIACSE